jgi:hypothetical protein
MAQKVSVHSCTVSHTACDLNRLVELRPACIYPRAAPRILFRSSGRQVLPASVPADAIIFNGNGMQVAVVNNGKAELRKVKVKRDLGTRVEVDSGIKAGDQVILNPTVTLVDGSKVQTMPMEGPD